MANRHTYVKRESQTMVTVQLELDTEGFTYAKWGGTQRCKPGDCIVSNAGDAYAVSKEAFERMYEPRPR